MKSADFSVNTALGAVIVIPSPGLTDQLVTPAPPDHLDSASRIW
jgi:hypothetical protein